MTGSDSSTRDLLVRAGVELLDAEGLGAVGLRAITRRAGVSHGAPRRHFPTHRSLLAAIARAGLLDLTAAVAARLDADGPPEDRLVAAGSTYVEFARNRRAMFELIFRHDLLEGAGGDLRAVSASFLSRLREVVDEVRGPSGDWTPTVHLWSALHGVAVLHGNRALDLLGDDCAPIERLVEETVRDSVSG